MNVRKKSGGKQNKDQRRENILRYLLTYLILGIKIDKIICILIEDCSVYVKITNKISRMYK